MPKGTGQRGHRTKGDSALSRKATHHQDSPTQPPTAEGTAPAAQPPFPPFEIPTSLREGLDLIRQRGPQVLDALRAKAEQRLGEMPSPVRTAVHLTERAVGLALWPMRIGARIVGRALETPAALIRILVARRTT
jgi:hypothetical protein